MKRLSTVLLYLLLLLAYTTVCRGQIIDTLFNKDTILPANHLPYKEDSSLLSSLDRLTNINKELVAWNVALKKGIDTNRIVTAIAPIEQQLNDLQELTNLPRHNNNLRYLNGSKIIADQLYHAVNKYEDEITHYFQKLHQLESAFTGLQLDSMQVAQYRQPALQQLYNEELTMLTAKWQKVKTGNATIITRLGILQGRLTKLEMSIVDLQETLRFELQYFNTRLFRHRYPLLSSKPDDPYYTPMKVEVSDTISFALNLIYVYVTSMQGMFIFNLLLACLLIYWIYHNHRFLTRKTGYAASIEENAPRVSKHPLAAACTVLFCFSPFLYEHMPFIISALFIVGLLVSLSFLLWERMQWKLRWRWIGLVFLFIRFDLMNLFIDVSYFERWVLIGLNIGCIYILITSYFLIIPTIKTYKKLLLAVILITAAQQVAAVGLNIAGYFNAARLFSINSVFNVITAMALKLSVDIIVELSFMFYLRLQHHKIIAADKEFTEIRQAARRGLVIFAILAWLFIFAGTANIYEPLYDAASAFLDQPRTIGNAVFNYGSVLIFVVIFGLGVLASRMIGVVIDLLSIERNTLFNLAGLKNAKLLFRLFILAAAVIIAFMASGIPMDRFTIILGALSVGIGFGLQHLVNNIVSGIIIAMEKPIRVGDVIELSPMAGVVTEIGLRSSTLKTKDGSDVIIPNGDLLAGKLINWTLSGRKRRLSIKFYVETANNLEVIKQKVHELITANHDILHDPAPSVVFQELTLYGLHIEILFWVKDLSLSKDTQSRLLEDIVRVFNENDIRIVRDLDSTILPQ